ncbi:MAG: hypothetical protein P8188_19100 [Gemmatimonadota bacterium]
MENRARELYRERTGWPWWLNLLVLGATAGALLGPVLEGSTTTMEPVTWGWMAVGTVTLMSLIYLFVAGLTVIVEPGRIRIGLGWGWPIRTTISLHEIVTLETVEYRPIRDFGGWGVRGRRSRRIWSARGNQAVRLELTDGRTIFIGSDQPRTLENRIRQAMSV